MATVNAVGSASDILNDPSIDPATGRPWGENLNDPSNMAIGSNQDTSVAGVSGVKKSDQSALIEGHHGKHRGGHHHHIENPDTNDPNDPNNPDNLLTGLAGLTGTSGVSSANQIVSAKSSGDTTLSKSFDTYTDPSSSSQDPSVAWSNLVAGVTDKK